MDIVYIFRHSRHRDEELRFSLRAVEQHIPWRGKVWIFGDRPQWLTDDTSRIEHVPHDAIAWLTGAKLPMRNTFQMFLHIALLPEVDNDFMAFADDAIVLQPLTPEIATRHRYLQDLSKIRSRGRGLYKDALWRTHDGLVQRGYSPRNYESHVPVWLNKRWVLEAAREFRPHITDDRFAGWLAKHAILAWAEKHVPGFEAVHLSKEGLYAGCHEREFTPQEIEVKCKGRTFLSFDDHAYNDAMRAFLTERFPQPSRFERQTIASAA